MYTYIPFFLSLPLTPLGHHRAPSWVPCAIYSSFPLAICLMHGNAYMPLFPLVSPSASCPASTSLFPLFASLFLPSQTLFSYSISVRKTEMCSRSHTIQTNGKVTAKLSLSPLEYKTIVKPRRSWALSQATALISQKREWSSSNWSDFEVAQLVGTRSNSFNLSGRSSFPALQSSWQLCSEAHPISAALSLKLLGLDSWPQRGPMLSECKQKIALAFPQF